jgi:surface antigen
VVAWDGREACRQSLYNNGTAALRLCRQLRAVAAIAAVASALAVAGCSIQLASLISKDDTDLQPTGSIVQPTSDVAHDAGPGPAELDLAYARAAASDALARGTRDASVPWQNPQSGAGGNITPLATSYNEGGLPCRDFLASYVHGSAQDWLQGAACRTASGTWEVTRLKALKPS